MATVQKTDTDEWVASESESIPNIIPKDDTDSATATESEVKYVAADELSWDHPITCTVINPVITVELVLDPESLIEF